MQAKLTWRHIRQDLSRGISESWELSKWDGQTRDVVGHVNHSDNGFFYYARIGSQHINSVLTNTYHSSLINAKRACRIWVLEALRVEAGEPMAEVILSLKTEYAKAIYAGIKTVELRRVAPNRPVKRMWIYESAPIRAITGYFTPGTASKLYDVKELVKEYTPEQLIGVKKQPWQVAWELGIQPRRAIPVIDPTRLLSPIHPKSDNWPSNWLSPQSWRYVTEDEAAFLKNAGETVKRNGG